MTNLSCSIAEYQAANSDFARIVAGGGYTYSKQIFLSESQYKLFKNLRANKDYQDCSYGIATQVLIDKLGCKIAKVAHIEGNTKDGFKVDIYFTKIAMPVLL